MEQVKLDIPRVLIFTKVSSTRLNNTLHVQYHRKQYELVMAVDKTKLKLPLGLPEAWNKGIDYETMIDQEATISDDTALLKVKDAERDEQLMNIFGIIRAQRHSHKTNIREAAIRLSNTLSPYENIRSLAYEMESGRLQGMKKDLTKRPRRWGRTSCARKTQQNLHLNRGNSPACVGLTGRHPTLLKH